MIANPVTSVAQKALLVVMGVLLVALGAASGMLWWDLRGTERKLDECRTTSAGLASALQVQNDAVLKWQAAGQDAQATTQKALDAVRKGNAAAKPELKRLADLIAAGKATDCGPAMTVIREGLR